MNAGPSTPPVLSVIIPAHNAARFLTQALDSVAAQTCAGLEVIVIDDGSTDDTAAIAKHRNATLIQLPKSGVSAARNVGVHAARAPLIAFLDADDLWWPDKIQTQIAALVAMPTAKMVITGYRMVDADGQDLGPGAEPPPVTLAQLMERNVVHTSTAVMRRDTFLALGGFDPALDACEDYDLWLRIAALSDHAILPIPAPLAAYRRHDGQTTRNWAKMHQGWTQVTARLARDHPQTWAGVARQSQAHHLEYCASLAFNSGDYRATRRLVWRAWRRGGLSAVRQPNMRHMTRVALNTLLPAPLQSALIRLKKGL